MKKDKILSKTEKDLLYSIALGDGCVYSPKDRSRYYLSVGHGPQQKDYCEWKMNLLNDSGMFQREMRLRKHNFRNTNGKICTQYRFMKGAYFFKEIWEDYHAEDRIERILNNIYSDRALAIWFMDDGATERHLSKKKINEGKEVYNRPAFHLCTHCFTEEENIKIAGWFEKRYQIRPRLGHDNRKNVRYTYLRFSAIDTEKIYRIIRPYVLQIESMKYKFRYVEEFYFSQ